MRDGEINPYLNNTNGEEYTMTRETDFEDFLNDYVGIGLIIALIIIAIGALFGAAIFSDSQTSAKIEHNFYLALEGKKVDDAKCQIAGKNFAIMLSEKKSGGNS